MLLMTDPILTSRLILRPFTMTDNSALMAVFGDEEVMRFGDGVQSYEQVSRWLRQITEDIYPKYKFGPMAVILRSTNELVGYCGLFPFDDIDGSPEFELGYRLERSAWGLGYATEVSIAICENAKHKLGLKRIVSLIDPENARSIRVAEKLGMHFEKDVMLPGYDHPDRLYSASL